MSEYGLFEADHVAQQEPARQQRVAANRFAAAMDAVHADYGRFLFAADGVDNFEDRLGAVRKDIVATVVKFVPVYPKVMREVIGSLKAEWRRQADINKEHDRDTKNPDKQEQGKRSITINERQRSKVRNDNGDPKGGDVESNTGDGSDSMGRNGHDIPHGDSKKVVKVRQKDERHTGRVAGAGDVFPGEFDKHPADEGGGGWISDKDLASAAGYDRAAEEELHRRLGPNPDPRDFHNGSRYADFDDEAGHTIGSDFAPGTYDRWDETPHEPRERSAAYRHAAPEWEQTSCKHCGQDIEGPAHGYERVPEGAYWDRGGNVSGSDNHRHEPFRHEGSRYAEMQDEPYRKPLIPEGDFHSYERRVDRGGPAKIQRDFGEGGDTGQDREGSEDHHVAKMALDLYSDWAQSNGLRVASTETLERYAALGVDDAEYFTIAAAIRQAECECDDDDDDREEDRDEDDRGRPPAFDSDDDEGGEDDGDDDGRDVRDDSDDESDSDSDSDDDSEYDDDDDDGEEDDTGDDDGDRDGDNPFADDDSDVPGPDEDIPGPDDSDDDGGDDFGPSANDIPPASDDDDIPGPDDGGGDDFGGGPQGPPSPDQFPPDDQQGTEPIDPVLIDQLLGLPPGTVEHLISEAVGGHPQDPQQMQQGGDPSQQLPGDDGPPWMTAAHLRKASLAARNRAYLEAASRLGFNRLAEDDGGGGSAPADPSMGGSDQLLDTALQAVTQTVDQKTQEFQQMIDPLTQALQAIEYAQTVEQAENPLDVTPPQGTVDVNPSASPAAQGAQEALQGAGGGAAPAPAGPPAAPDPRQQQAAYRVAKHHGLGQAAYNMMVTAMSRKHYEHVAEAIRGLPFEHRPGIAASLADMFKNDNGRFNPNQFFNSAGVTASRHRADNNDGSGGGGGTGAPSGSTAGDPGMGGTTMGDASLGTGANSTAADDLSDPMSMTGSRRPLVVDSRTSTGGHPNRRQAASWAPETELNTFHFPDAKPPAPNDGIAVDNLPAIKGPGKTASYDWSTWERRASHDVEAKGVLDMFKNFTQSEEAKGLNTGAPADAVTKFQQVKGPSLGEGQMTKLKNTVMPSPGASTGEKESNRRTANWFMPRVAGWEWNDYQNGYLSKVAHDFETPCCHTAMPVPSHGNCRCGKLWNGYGIGDDKHLASGTAEQFIVREIPVRDGVIMAGRRVVASPGEWMTSPHEAEGSFLGHTPDHKIPQYLEHLRGKVQNQNISQGELSDLQGLAENGYIHPDDMELHEAAGTPEEDFMRGQDRDPDKDPFDPREFGARKTACWPGCHEDEEHARKYHKDKESSYRFAEEERSYSGEADYNKDISDPGYDVAEDVQWEPDEDREDADAPHAPAHNAGLNPFLPRTADWTKYDDDDPARQGGPKKPPSTDIKGGDPHWHSRDEGGTFKRTSPFSKR